MSKDLNVSPLVSRKWSQLRERLRNTDPGWVFRGHADASWRLCPTLERLIPNTLGRVGEEIRMESDFKRHAENLLRGEPVPDSRLEWLALMQHHGGATRLLDFTWSPYVAAYFAVENADENTDSVIWAINLQACAKLLRDAFGEADLARGINETNDWPNSMPLVSGVVPCAPTRGNARQMMQQGIFVASGDLAESFETNLRLLCRGVDIRKVAASFLIRGDWRGEILDDLRLMNITRATLFPGLDGLAKSIAMRLSRESPEQRERRLAVWALGDLAP